MPFDVLVSPHGDLNVSTLQRVACLSSDCRCQLWLPQISARLHQGKDSPNLKMCLQPREPGNSPATLKPDKRFILCKNSWMSEEDGKMRFARQHVCNRSVWLLNERITDFRTYNVREWDGEQAKEATMENREDVTESGDVWIEKITLLEAI